MKGNTSNQMKQCGLCARWTSDGDDIPSGNRDRKTGITPMDNFVCWRCQHEARGLQLLGGKAEKFLRDRGLGVAAIRL